MAGTLPRTATVVLAAVLIASSGCGRRSDIDLTFDHGLRSSPTPPTSLVPLTLSFDIINDSLDDVDNVEWVINRDGVAFKSGIIGHIDDGDFDFGTVSFTETAGSHIYEFVIDPANRIRERSEDNNVSVITVVVPPGGTG
ncbi:MAG: hypothetical protein H0V44_06560 [Planctomycetes bacterium]|nr:hypothetical protein [Planctomycetota bacterium]